MSDRVTLGRIRLPARAELLQWLRERVRCLLMQHAVPKEDTDCVVLAVNEACMNVIQHAYGNAMCGDILVEFSRNGDLLVVRLTDNAPCVDAAQIKSRDLEEVRPGGIGVHLMHELMDGICFMHCPGAQGNILEMQRRLAESPEDEQ